MAGDFQLLWDLVIVGFVIGVFLAVLFGAIRVGWQFAPWIIIGAGLLWLFG